VLSGRGLCDELITRPEESYRLWCVVVCDLETSRIGAPYIYDISRLRVKYASSNFMVKIQEHTNKVTILKYKAFTINTLELRHVSTVSLGSSSMSVYQYLDKT